MNGRLCSSNVISCLVSTAKKEFGSVDQGTLKQVYAALVALLLEAAKLDKDVAAVRLELLRTSPDN